MIYTLLGYFGLNPIMEKRNTMVSLDTIDSDYPKNKYFQSSANRVLHWIILLQICPCTYQLYFYYMIFVDSHHKSTYVYALPCYCGITSHFASLVSLLTVTSFSVYSVWLSCLTIFCPAIAQNSYVHQPIKATHIHSIQKDISPQDRDIGS